MKVIFLCGGRGIKLGNASSYIPKGMVKLGHRPTLWHIMKRYSTLGFDDFILAVGSGGNMIRDYFFNYERYANDIHIDYEKGTTTLLSKNPESSWKVTIVETGETALSGARIHRCRKYLTEGEDFMVAYSDCLANVDITKLIKFHEKISKVATITGVSPPYREGELIIENDLVKGFYEYKKVKSQRLQRYINGGFMVFKWDIFGYLSPYNECKLETEVFGKLIEKGQLAVFAHHGFWRWLDTERDYIYLSNLADKNKMYWLHD